MYDPPIRLGEKFFGKVFMPMVIAHAMAIKYHHYGVFFWIDALWRPREITTTAFAEKSRPVSWFPGKGCEVPRALAESVIRRLEYLGKFPAYCLRIFWEYPKGRQWKGIRYRTRRDAMADLHPQIKRHRIGEFVIYRRVDVYDGYSQEARPAVNCFTQYREDHEWAGESILEYESATPMGAFCALRNWETEFPGGMGAVYVSIEYRDRRHRK